VGKLIFIDVGAPSMDILRISRVVGPKSLGALNVKEK